MDRIHTPAPDFNRNLRSRLSPRSPLRRVTRASPCPVCARPRWCSVSADGRVAICMRVASERRTRDGGHLHFLGDAPPRGGTVIRFVEREPEPLPAQADPAHLDAIYCALLRGHLVLSRGHREALRARGLPDGVIDANGYRSAPDRAFGDRVARALAVFGLEGVPGFYLQCRRWRMAFAGGGILVPVRDGRGRVRGLQLRRDDGAPRYVWFSSAGRRSGASSGAPAHYRPAGGPGGADGAVITEGPLKADVVANLMGQTAVGLAGVSSFRPDFAEELRLQLPGVRRLAVAFDSDWRTKPHVRAPLDRLVRLLGGAGYDVGVLAWPPEHKGLDDYLLSGRCS